MKILAGVLATCLLATPAFAQSGSATSATTADQGKPPADDTPPGDDATAAAKPVDPASATPEPEEAPEGTTPVKPADAPQG